ncbi:MAG: hypothetical protein ACRETR_03210 [Steroidobacteraceae bacterium]
MIESGSAKAPRPRPDPGKSADEAQKDKIQRQLDEALADSFPASDPVSIVTSHEEEDWGEVESKP